MKSFFFNKMFFLNKKKSKNLSTGFLLKEKSPQK